MSPGTRAPTGAGNFDQHQVVTPARWAASVFASDVDGDGDLDALASLDGDLIWSENGDAEGAFASPQVISDGVGGWWVYATDIDGDRDMDVFSTKSGKIVWCENLSPEIAAVDANRGGQFNKTVSRVDRCNRGELE